jgi:DNA-binding MarR family transcriptional regulator
MKRNRGITQNEIAILFALCPEDIFPPTMRELSIESHVASGSIRASLRRLERFGHVEIMPNRSRGFRITPTGREYVRTLKKA